MQILLVDDDDATNFYHRKIINRMQENNIIYEVNNGKEAIAFVEKNIKSTDNNEKSDSILILLDINMPLINGWEFLDYFQNKEPSFQKKCLILILTTSLNPDDEKKAATYSSVKGYLKKPLNLYELQELIQKNGLFS